MPELPEIEIVKRSLSKMINKSKIVDIKIKNKNLRYKISSKFCHDLIGERILKITRRSKYLIFNFKKKNTSSTCWNERENVSRKVKR